MIEAALRAAAVPPFHAMAMSREAAALEASGRRILHLEVGQPSTPLPQLARDGGARPPRRAARLHQRRRAALAAPSARRALRRRRSAADPGGRRRVCRVHAGVPDALRTRRPCRGAGARLSLLSQRLVGPRHANRSRSRSDRRAGGPRRPPISTRPATSTGWCSPHRRTRPARCFAPTRWPRSPPPAAPAGSP